MARLTERWASGPHAARLTVCPCVTFLLLCAAGCNRILPLQRPAEAGDATADANPAADAPPLPDGEVAHGTLVAGQVGTLPHALSGPYGMALAADGTLYVAERYGHRISAIDLAQQKLTTVAGTGSEGFVDNVPAGQAQFSDPRDVVVDPDGRLLVGDSGNDCVRVIDNGWVSTLPGSETQLSSAYGVALDHDGVVYVLDHSADAVVRVAGGLASLLASGLGAPYFIAVHQGAAVVSESSTNRIVTLDLQSGAVQRVVGSGAAGPDDGPLDSASFDYPTGVLVDSAGRVLVADTSNDTVRVIEGNVVRTLAGDGERRTRDGAALQASFNAPYGLALDGASGTLYVSEKYGGVIRTVQLRDE